MDRVTTHRVGERFRLGRVLKASASGTVYVASERGSDREVVVKIIGLAAPLPPDAVRARFQRAVALLGEISHPAFPRLLEVGWASASEAYVITDLVQGSPLTDVGPGQVVRTLALLMRVGDALDRLHTAGSAHLNVAPDNVLVTPDNTVKLVGLGSGWLPGTVTRSEFIAPELASDPTSAVPWRADIFSFARTICGALGLAAVPEGSQRFIVELSGQVSTKVVDPRRFREVLERSLHRQPEERPSSLSEVLRVLEAAIGPELLQEATVESTTTADADEEPQDRTVKIDLETVTRLRAERDKHRTGATAPETVLPTESAAAPDRAAEDQASSETPGRADGLELDRGEAALERTTRIDTAKARLAAEKIHEQQVAAGPSEPEGSTPRPKKRSPDTSPIPIPTAMTEPAPAAVEGTGTGLDVSSGGDSPPATVTEAEQPVATVPDERTVGTDSEPITSPLPAPAAVQPAARSETRPWLWVAFFVAVVGLAVVIWVITSPRRDPGPGISSATVDVASAPIEAAPTVPAARQLIEQAEVALTDGDASAAELSLAGLSDDQIAALPRQERERIMTIRTAIAERRRWDLVRALDAAIANANLGEIRRAVSDLAGDETGPAQSQELQRKLGEARRLVQLDGNLSEALRQRNWGRVLETSDAILKVLPSNTEAASAKSDAAAALETEADELGDRGSYDTALARLEVLRRWWPDREGLATRSARLEARRQEVRTVRAKIASAEEAGRAGHPDDGLGVLAGLSLQGPYSQEIRVLKSRLQEQLTSLDEGIPRVSPAPQSSFEYERNQPAVIALQIDDDYRVATVALFARREGGTGYAQFIALKEGPDIWVVRIPVAFHQNETVEFYATALDPSGHRGELGNEAAPLELKRRRRGLFGR